VKDMLGADQKRLDLRCTDDLFDSGGSDDWKECFVWKGRTRLVKIDS
jgi:hypothetical protein